MMKNTKILVGIIAMYSLVAYSSCKKCPECPQNNIVIDDADTISLRIVIDDADTISLKMAAPTIMRDNQVEKASIVIDDADMARLIIESADTSKFNIKINPRLMGKDTLQQRQ
ncbi:MAG: hypothetical protein SFU99_19835 [Saprospiraceae bacterium]|nr:hypothetical protein [Saprospiraceae bacterium]